MFGQCQGPELPKLEEGAAGEHAAEVTVRGRAWVWYFSGAMDPVGPITEFFRTVNYVEGGLWGGWGVGFAVRAAGRTRNSAARWNCVIAAVTLFAFGASDVVETRTGAWWHPWWLLVWKGVCVIVLAGLIAAWWKGRTR